MMQPATQAATKAHQIMPETAKISAQTSWYVMKNNSQRTYGQWTLARSISSVADARAEAGKVRDLARRETDAVLGVRSNSLCSGPNIPSAKALDWCASIPVLMKASGNARLNRLRNLLGVSGSA